MSRGEAMVNCDPYEERQAKLAEQKTRLKRTVNREEDGSFCNQKSP
ncbi:hypothetical protein [Massiliimalia timonensis]|nr:hypothetical protein [Massiliimalia timonensis]